MIQERRDGRNGRTPDTPGSLELNPCIGIIESNPRYSRFIGRLVEGAGYRVVKARDGRGALNLISANYLDLLILADPLPMDYLGNTTYQIVTRIKEFSSLPVIVLSPNSSDIHVAGMLEVGADDYMIRGGIKDFSGDVLLAKVRAVLRRANMKGEKERSPILTNGELVIDTSQHLVTLKGQELKLTPTEYRLLTLFVKSLGRTLLQDYILSQVWGDGYEGVAHLLSVNITRLRSKLGENSRKPHFIVTQVGFGYKMPELDPER